jgi:hypothetical protein
MILVSLLVAFPIRGLVFLVMLLSTMNLVIAVPTAQDLQQIAAAIKTQNRKVDGYRGIWYFNQKSDDEYVYKYSGGLGTYCAKHRPFAVYCSAVDKTFFCYGGATRGNNHQLLHMVSYFDHRTRKVPRPTLLIDKKTNDAHDNPIISVDHSGYVWIFSTSHGRSRPSFVHRSKKPYSIDQFVRVRATYLREGKETALDNFSYMQVWPRLDSGFTSFFTRYGAPAARTLMFMKSMDGRHWSKWQRLAAIEKGHYQVSTARGQLAASAFNYHPQDKGLNYRTNLYYMETTDCGDTWHNAQGRSLKLPVTQVDNAALVHDYASAGKNVYMKDIQFDAADHPVILVVTSNGYESGPGNDPRTWTVVRWTGKHWDFSDITTSDNNYDMGSLYLEEDVWRIVAPTETGPQPYNPGGEMAMWTSQDEGRKWHREKRLTVDSPRNHTYARRPVNAHSDFYAFWADGHGRQPSKSLLYFCNKQGDVFQLPALMQGKFSRPQRVRARSVPVVKN